MIQILFNDQWYDVKSFSSKTLHFLIHLKNKSANVSINNIKDIRNVKSPLEEAAEDFLSLLIETNSTFVLEKLIEHMGYGEIAQYLHDKYNLLEIASTLEDEVMDSLKEKYDEHSMISKLWRER